MPKRKASSEKNGNWSAVVKILEKPGVSNRLLEYLCFLNISVSDKAATHRDWIETLNDIWKNHPVVRIQKLAEKSIKNYQVMYLHLLYENTGLNRSWYRSCVHSLLWAQD
jgi:hypothetical protein